MLLILVVKAGSANSGQSPITDLSLNKLSNQFSYFIDAENIRNPSLIEDKEFIPFGNSVLNLDFVPSPVWIYFNGVNALAEADLYLDINYPLLDTILVYIKEGGRWKLKHEMGLKYHVEDRAITHQHYIIPFDLPRGEEVEMLIMVTSKSPIQVPIRIYKGESIVEELGVWDFGKGLFYGLMVVMLLYNFFVSLVTQDRSYYFYVAYVFFIGLTQALLDGTLQIIMPGIDYSKFQLLVITAPALAGIFAIQFAKFFLHVKDFSRGLYYGFVILQVLYAFAISLDFFGFYMAAYRSIDILGLVASVYGFVTAIVISLKGYRPARLFLLAWSFFFAGIILFVFRNLGFIPYNAFTEHVLLIGISAEVVLLSFALASRINTLRKETTESQANALRISKENEQIIRDQNIILEQRVDERTGELQKINEELTLTLTNLREAQSQLVDAEKMASLGQLTAGIAHEINNPINFVTSNIGPLRRDLGELYEILAAYEMAEGENAEEVLEKASQLKQQLDYDFLREEIDSLVAGIADGANRTSEIVKGLRNFSRLDEDALKEADLNEGLTSTLVLLRSKLPQGVKVKKEYDKELEKVECLPGKINQVFMNILSNAIYAVIHKHYEDGQKPQIGIKTEGLDNEVKIYISDNGIGMDEFTRKKIFDPFFTTKDVGEGTGLGMSIVFKIIEKHNGSLEVHSKLGLGTEFIITLPMRQPKEFE